MSVINLERYVLLRIEQARLLAGLNKTEMASRLDMALSTYHAIEAGQRKLDISLLQRIADVTERDLSFFLPMTAGKFGDLAAALQHLYPDMELGTVNEILRLVELLHQRDLAARKGGAGSGGPHAPSTSRIADNG